MEAKVEYIAKACHEANRVWCQANGDDTQKHWSEAEQWQRDSATQVEKELGFNRKAIVQCLIKKSKKSNNYLWLYV